MDKKEKKYLIYSYIINNFVYVGLTKDICRRHNEHLKDKYNDSLYKYCLENNQNLPEPIILERGLTSTEAQVKEGDWLKYYIDKKYNIINKAKCGYQKSSLGGVNYNNINNNCLTKCLSYKKIISYEECYAEALKYKTIKEFKINNLKFYNYALKMGWVKEYTWIKKEKNDINNSEVNFSDYIKCVNECKSLSDFSLKYRKYYLWGLKNDLNKKYFKKDLKMKNYICDEYINMSIDDIVNEFKKYGTKSELCKKNSKFYNHCRICDLLKYFPKKEKTYERVYTKVEKYNINDIDIDKLILIPSFKDYYIDTTNCVIYKKLKKRINKVEPFTKKNGLIYYSLYKLNGDKKVYPYHKFLRLALGLNEYNCVSYIDGDYSNIKQDNLHFFNYTIENNKQIHEYYNDFIDNDGKIYNRVDEVLIKGDKKENGRWKFGRFFVDEIVYDFFVDKIEYGRILIEHIDGDLLNNNYKNLFVSNKKNGKIEIIEKENTNTISIVDLYGKRFNLGNISDKYVLKKLINSLNENIANHNFVDEWFYEFKKNEYTFFLDEDIKANIEKIRSESCGCYWHSSRQCWKSKIYFNNKEYSLGYFNKFEEGKFIYDIACTYIKHDKFNEWYKTIEEYRKYVKLLFK